MPTMRLRRSPGESDGGGVRRQRGVSLRSRVVSGADDRFQPEVEPLIENGIEHNNDKSGVRTMDCGDGPHTRIADDGVGRTSVPSTVVSAEAAVPFAHSHEPTPTVDVEVHGSNPEVDYV